MLNTGHLVHHKKQEILENVSGEFWNKFQQNAFIASKKPIILLVEGKHDKIHIHNAFDALKGDYPQLDFQCFVLNGETKIQPFLSGLYESDFYTDKLYIGVYDNDGAGEKSFNNGFEKVKDNFKKLKENNGKENNSYFAIKLPKPNDITCDCTIETLYELEKFEEAIQSATQNALGHLKNKSIDEITKGIKEQAKNILSENSQTFNAEDFKNFRALLDLILEISEYRNSLIKGTKKEKKKQQSPETSKENSPNGEKYVEVYTARRNTEVNAHYYNEKKITIKSGSKLSIDVVDSYTPKIERNKELKKIADLQENYWVLKEDKTFNSVSGAINYATGGNMNGWEYWLIKENNNPLETIREK